MRQRFVSGVRGSSKGSFQGPVLAYILYLYIYTHCIILYYTILTVLYYTLLYTYCTILYCTLLDYATQKARSSAGKPEPPSGGEGRRR